MSELKTSITQEFNRLKLEDELVIENQDKNKDELTAEQLKS